MLMFIIHLLENMMTINFNETCVPNHLEIARAEKKDYQNASDIYVDDIVVMKVEKGCQLLNQLPIIMATETEIPLHAIAL